MLELSSAIARIKEGIMRYVGLRHFTYSGIRVEPGLVFPKLAVKNNLYLEQHGFVEAFHGREEELISCQQCPAKFVRHEYMQRHVDRTVHQEGRVVHAEEGPRTTEQERELDKAAASIPKEKPGFVEVAPSGETSETPKRIKRRK